MVECPTRKLAGFFMRFTIRDLLWLMAVVAFAIGWLQMANEVERSLREQQVGIFFVMPRVVRRVLQSELDIASPWQPPPHRKCCVIPRDRLLWLVALDELGVARDVVAVGMRVEDEQFVVVPGVFAEPAFDQLVDDPAQGEELGGLGRTGVDAVATFGVVSLAGAAWHSSQGGLIDARLVVPTVTAPKSSPVPLSGTGPVSPECRRPNPRTCPSRVPT